jgi:hypothetical protein
VGECSTLHTYLAPLQAGTVFAYVSQFETVELDRFLIRAALLGSMPTTVFFSLHLHLTAAASPSQRAVCWGLRASWLSPVRGFWYSSCCLDLDAGATGGEGCASLTVSAWQSSTIGWIQKVDLPRGSELYGLQFIPFLVGQDFLILRNLLLPCLIMCFLRLPCFTGQM